MAHRKNTTKNETFQKQYYSWQPITVDKFTEQSTKYTHQYKTHTNENSIENLVKNTLRVYNIFKKIRKSSIKITFRVVFEIFREHRIVTKCSDAIFYEYSNVYLKLNVFYPRLASQVF